MRVLITGDRSLDDSLPVFVVLHGQDALREDDPDFEVIEGQCPYGGADKYAEEWAKVFATKHKPFPAKWTQYGKAAGPIRNQQMLDEGKPDVVWAFHDDLKNSKGTKDMVKRALKARLPVYLVSRPRLEDLD